MTSEQELEAIVAQGVHTSSELIGRLVRAGYSSQNARQILSRQSNKNGIWRSQDLRLPRDERLFADRRAVGTQEFFSQVGAKLTSTGRHGLARCVGALGAHGLLHRIDLFRLLAVAPASDNLPKQSRRGPSYESELRSLEELGARVIQRGTALESLIAPGATLPDEDLYALASDAIEHIRYEALLARILTERLRCQNLLSWNRIEVSGLEKPYVPFNDQMFSAYGFSYLGPLKRWKVGAKTPTPCPVVIDCYHGVCSLPQVESFLQRIERATIRRRKQQPVIGVIAARDFHRNAWDKARRESLMTVSFRQMFGDEALDAMVEVERLLGGFGQSKPEDSQKQFAEIAKLMEELKTNPVIADLRAIGLEAMCALIVQSQGFESPELGRIVPWQNSTRDVDVFAIRGDDELRVVECKAYHRRKSLLDSDVSKFFTETLPALKKWLREKDRHFKKCVAEIWTTGPKGKNAELALKELTPPRGDTWKLRRMDDMHDEIPQRIRGRGVKLLKTIAQVEMEIGDLEAGVK